MRVLMFAAAGLALAGCATTPIPAKRPMTAATIEALDSAPVSIVENNNGVAKSWFMQDSSAAGASYGLIGALVTATMDAIVNAGPSRQARKSADEVAEVAPVDAINESLAEALAAVAAAEAETGGLLAAGDVEARQPILEKEVRNNALEIQTTYTLAEDASALRVSAVASIESDSVTYATPYSFEGKPPKSETMGPIYRNTFTYESSQLPVPVLSDELRAQLIASIEESFRDENGNPPAAESEDFKAYTNELEKAKDDTLSKSEIAIFLTRNWIADDGAMLWREIEAAHAFIAEYVARDLKDTQVPSIDGQDELLDTAAEGRVVRRVGQGVVAGSYVSSPANPGGFPTYGNAIGVARAHMERAEAIKKGEGA